MDIKQVMAKAMQSEFVEFGGRTFRMSDMNEFGYYCVHEETGLETFVWWVESEPTDIFYGKVVIQ